MRIIIIHIQSMFPGYRGGDDDDDDDDDDVNVTK
jgi:hypothetical protein